MTYFKNPQKAFEEAITKGVLNTKPGDRFYAGNWMYMQSDSHGDAFKNIMTREYIYIRPGNNQ